MAKSAPTLPKQLFVVGKMQYEYDSNTGKNVPMPWAFGFLNAYEPNKKTWQNKRQTQMTWAYQEWGVNVVERNGVFYAVGQRSTGEYDYTLRTYKTYPVDEPLRFQPQVWDNVPISGFKILKSVSRYSTSNKLWRILDPRGLELEISTGCMEEIIGNAGILKGGEIDAPCQWMSNKNLIVAP